MMRHWITPVFIFSILSIIYAIPIFKNIENWGQMDWDQYTFWHAVPREVIFRYLQLPLWNPYTNGGNVLLAHTHSPFLSPFYISVLIFGPALGLKIEIVLHLFLGMLGMFFLSKHLGLGKFSSYMPPFVYMLSSIYTLHLAEGHVEWLTMAFLPWVFFCFLKSLKQIKFFFGGTLFLSLAILGGSVNVSNIIILLFFVFSVFTMLRQRSIIPLKSFACICIGTFLLCSVKLIPMLEFLKENPRRIESNEVTEASVLASILLSRDQAALYQNTKWTGPEQRIRFRGRDFEYGWHEYGAYVGIVPLILAAAGILSNSRQHWPLLLTGIVSLWLSLGGGAFYNLWGLSHKLPVYKSLHVPSRFILGFIFILSIFSGFGLLRLEGKGCKKNLQLLICALVGAVFFDLFLVNRPLLKNMFAIKPVKVERYREFRQRYRDFNIFAGFSRSSMYPGMLSNSGIINGYEVINVEKGNVLSLDDPEYRGEVYLAQNKGSVAIDFFSPNKITVKVSVNDLDTLVLNQNHYKGWRAKTDCGEKEIKPFNGLVAVPVNPEDKKVIFYYLPFSFIIGSLTTSLTIIIGILCWRKLKANRNNCHE